MFCIDNSGQISTTKPLDFETTSSYTLEAKVELDQNSDTTTVKVNVQDVNDNYPVFEKEVYTVGISENAGNIKLHYVPVRYFSSIVAVHHIHYILLDLN